MSYAAGIKRRLPTMLISLAILGVAWYLLKLDVVITGAIATVIVVSALVPVRYSNLVSGLGLLAIAGVSYFHYGSQTIATLFGLIGLVEVGMGINDLRRSPR